MTKKIKRMRNRNKNKYRQDAFISPQLDKDSIITAFLSQGIVFNEEWLQSDLSKEQIDVIASNARVMGVDNIQCLVESISFDRSQRYDQVIKILQITGFVSGKPCGLGLDAMRITPDQPLFTLISNLLLMPLKDPRGLQDIDHNPFEGKTEEVKEIGWELHKKGGFNLMYAIAELIPKCEQRLLDHLWHGVGDWKC